MIFTCKTKGRVCAPTTREGKILRYNSPIEKAVRRNNAKMSQQTRNDIDSKPEYMDPKAYSRFKAFNTDYGSGRKCAYGDKQKACDPGCRFWMSCIKGRHGKEDTDARSNAETKSHKQE